MVNQRVKEAIAGALFLGAAAAACYFAFRARLLDPPPPPAVGTFLAYFDDVGDLKSDAQVVVRGVEVGRVVELRWVARGFEQTPPLRPQRVAPPAGLERLVVAVHFDVFHADLPVHLDSASVALGKPSLLGDSWLELEPGRWPIGAAPPPLGVRPQIAGRHEIRAELQPSFESVVAQAQPLLDKIDRAVEVLETKVINTENAALLTAAITGANETLARLQGWLDADSPEGLQQSVLRPVEQVVESIQTRLDELGPTVQASSQLVESFTETSASAKQALLAATDLLENDESQLQATLAALRETLASLDATVAENRAPLQESLLRLRSVLWRFETLVIELTEDPSTLLFGGDGSNREAPPWDDTSLRNSGRAPPYRQRDERDR